MTVQDLFFQRYDPLYQFWLAVLWKDVPPELLRQRPHPNVNSIAWNLWHLTRVEDAGLNRFVSDRPQVFDEGRWMQRLNLPWRHQGTDMTFAEVDELDARIDVEALHAYSDAVQARTREIVSGLNIQVLDETMQPDRLRLILFDEGLAHPSASGLLENYTGWTKGKCLFSFGLTHPWQHVGEIGVIVGLLGLNFD